MEKEKISQTPDFRSLLTYENPKREFYDQLILDETQRNGYARGSKDRFMAYSWEINGWGQHVASYLKAKPLVDLGGGYLQEIAILAEAAQSSIYCNVDKYVEETDRNPDIPHQLLTMDLLDFLSRLEGISTNFSINSIDRVIIDDERYHKGIAEELGRIMDGDTVVFGLNAYAFKYLSDFGFEDIWNNWVYKKRG